MRTFPCRTGAAAALAACLAAATAAAGAAAADPAPGVDRYDVTWTTPSKDPSGSMPLGNGAISLNAWIDEAGDLVFYIGRTDSWGDNARLLKVGRVRVTLDPRPPVAAPAFRQTLRLADATMEVRYGDDGPRLRLWVDANHPVIHVTVESPKPVAAAASIELWRTRQETLPGIECSDIMLDRSKPDSQHAPTVVEPDTVLANQTGRIGWYHRNVKSVGPALTAEVQGLTGFARPDPLMGRTFGAVIQAEGGRRVDDLHLESPAATSHRFSVYVVARHPSTPEAWLEAVSAAVAAAEQTPFARRRDAHEQWWREFWDRSWIHVTPATAARHASLVPTSDLPVRLGEDQGGGNRFAGEMGRVTILGRALDAEAVRRLARTDRAKPAEAGPGVLYSAAPAAAPAALDGSAAWAFDQGLTIEAWVKPAALPASGARLVDKITPGGSDGFLLDTWPGNSVRLIVGNVILKKADALPADRWTHVAAVVDPAGGGIRLCLDGETVDEQAVDATEETFAVSRGYALQRFLNACAGRGAYPIKFNGSIFTVPSPGAPGDADYRRWGPGYWWQNTRLPYIGMCAAGDFDLMQPLFRMYGRDLMPLLRYRTRLYLGHDGVYIPECIYFWGDVFSETYGWTPFAERQDKLQESRWHKWEWVSGPELACLMLDYYDHTLDEAFLAETALPMAQEVLTFFDQQYPVDARGRLVMQPAQACETWWECTNPMPELAGLHALTERVLALPERLTDPARRTFWQAFRKKLPDLPTREVDGRRMLAPAERFDAKQNCENPELYAVFPFRRVAVGRPDIDLGIEALAHREDRGHTGWRQDDIFMAYLGLAGEARANLVARARTKDAGSRFPAFWGPNYDWVPDQDHGGVLMKALQAMLLQTDGRRLFLLPAWPRDWNADFRLHAPGRTTVEGRVRDGRLEGLTVTPAARKADLTVMEPQP